jgi:hypothetical protein
VHGGAEVNTAAGGRRRRARRAAAGRPTSGHVRFACGEVRQRLATARQAPALGVLANTARFWAACQHRNSEPQEPAFAGSTRRCLILTLLAAEAIDQVAGACHWQGYRLSGRRVQGPCSRQAGSRRRTSCAAWRAGTCLQVVEFSEAGLAPVSPPLLGRRVGHARGEQRAQGRCRAWGPDNLRLFWHVAPHPPATRSPRQIAASRAAHSNRITLQRST